MSSSTKPSNSSENKNPEPASQSNNPIEKKDKQEINDLKPFLRELASSKPIPGGGSVAALTAALAGSCATMALKLAKESDHAEKFQHYADFAYKMIEEDMKVFEGVSLAWKRPKKTEEEKAARKEAIEAATLPATEVPLRCAQLSMDILRDIHKCVKLCSKHSVSDCGAAASLAYAAFQSSLLNVKINLKTLSKSGNFERRSRFKVITNEVASMKDLAKTYYEESLKEVNKKLDA